MTTSAELYNSNRTTNPWHIIQMHLELSFANPPSTKTLSPPSVAFFDLN